MALTKKKYNTNLSVLRGFRRVFCDKLNLSNAYIDHFNFSGIVSLDLKSLEDFDSARLIAAVFILRLLTGLRPYVMRFGLFQTFREKDYDLLVQVNVRRNSIYPFLNLLAYEILPYVSKADCFISALKQKKGILVLFTISDLSFIRIVETHSAFFKWHDCVRVNLYFPTDDLLEIIACLSALKIDVSSLSFSK